MSGIEGIGAIIGVADVACRSIFGLYNFVRTLKDAPLEVQGILRETSALQLCLTELRVLETAGEETHAAIRRVGLSQVVNSCGEACGRLHNDLIKWKIHSSQTWNAKLQFRRHKKSIDSTLAEIGEAKQTAILTVLVTQLSIQLTKPTPDCANSGPLRDSSVKVTGLCSSPSIAPACVLDDTDIRAESVNEAQTFALMELQRLTQANTAESPKMAAQTTADTADQIIDRQVRARCKTALEPILASMREQHNGTSPTHLSGRMSNGRRPGDSARDSGAFGNVPSGGGEEVVQDWEGVTMIGPSSKIGIYHQTSASEKPRQKWRDIFMGGEGAREYIGIFNPADVVGKK